MRTPFFSCLLFITSRFAQKILICLSSMLLFQTSSFSLVSGQCLNDQRSMLLQLNNTLIYNSSLSTKLVQWNQNIDCCNWNGVTCDDFGHVIGLKLRGESIYGSIPSTIGNLSKLETLDLSENSFTGPIPSTIGNLSKLVSLNFAINSFTGSIPVFSMSNKLEHTDLSYNNLNGSLSSTHFEGLSNLLELDLSSNSLTGNIPTSLFRLPSLQILRLADNKFSGHIPKSFFRLEELIDLDLSYNFFNGTIQLEDFQTLQNLNDLDLSYNHLSVNIRSVNSEFFSFPQLSYLYLASCNLSRFPNLRNQTQMSDLDLSNNKISGDIPSWIWEVGNGSLFHLNLSHNSLMNLQKPYHIPGSLETLDLHSNMLSGELPYHIPGYLWYGDFSNNHFQGRIQFAPAVLLEFSFFSVANNRLTGEIPISLCNADSLNILDLSGNLLSGGLPPCLVKNFTDLKVLNIGGNNISGNIPDTFPVDCSLNTLDLSRNKLRGNIPASLANCESLQVMNVASNNLNGIFPCILLNSSSLHILVLRSNKFFGDIFCPRFNQTSSNLQIIDMAFNSFTGFLDTGFISSFTGMKLKNSPRLTSNPLGYQGGPYIYYQDKVTVTSKGLELEVVKIFTDVTSIDFSSNKFRGAIPETFGELRSLHSLNLSHNSFTGTIPEPLGNLTNLESLDLSANQLTGNIPTELVSLKFLSFFDVSYNELVGRIPSGFQFETFTAASYEGNLGLCGLPTIQSCGPSVNQSCDSNIPKKETSTTSTGEKDVDWMLMLAGLGYAVGLALVVVPPLFSRRWGDRWEELQVKLLKLICPR